MEKICKELKLLVNEYNIKKGLAIKYLFDGLTSEEEQSLANKILLMDKRGLDEILQDLYKNNIWEKIK